MSEEKTWNVGNYHEEGCLNPAHQVAMTPKFYIVAPNIYWLSVWNLFLITRLARLLRLWKICATLAISL
jgi:hypothetical protein